MPPAPIQELRDLTRTRKQLVREISQHSLRIQKVLEDANIKVGSVLSNVLGTSGRAMLAAIIVVNSVEPIIPPSGIHGRVVSGPIPSDERVSGDYSGIVRRGSWRT